MKFRLKKQPIITAVQWKGWPHKVKGIERHPKYPNLARLKDDYMGHEICPTHWIVNYPDGGRWFMSDVDFNSKYEKIK